MKFHQKLIEESEERHNIPDQKNEPITGSFYSYVYWKHRIFQVNSNRDIHYHNYQQTEHETKKKKALEEDQD
jgi:hypothetical protein